MKLYIYRGLNDERVAKDVIHAIVEENVTIIKRRVFYTCKKMPFAMGDNSRRIEKEVFYCCYALRLI